MVITDWLTRCEVVIADWLTRRSGAYFLDMAAKICKIIQRFSQITKGAQEIRNPVENN